MAIVSIDVEFQGEEIRVIQVSEGVIGITAGVGVPTGGIDGQVLTKVGSGDFNVDWETPAVPSTGTVTSVSVTTAHGVSGSVTNPTTTPAITLTLGAITPTTVVASGAISGSNLSGTNTGDQTSVTGNAGTATALQTPRTINGVSFNGTGNITVTAVAAAGTLTGTTLASNVVASSLTSAGGGAFGTAAYTAATAYTAANSPISGATKTKITYDTKGLVTTGVDATTADISDSSNKRYVTDSQLTVISNTSGTNTGDQTTVTGNAGTATVLQNARTINGVSFNGSANIVVTADAGTLTSATLAAGVTGSSLLSAAGGSFGTAAFTATGAYVAANGAITGATKTKITYDSKGLVTVGADATTADIADSLNKRYVTDANLTTIGNQSGTNTGDQTSVSGNAGTATALQTARTVDGVSFNGTANITIIAPGTHAVAGKTTPVDADELPLVDSAASNVLKKLTWANLKAAVLALGIPTINVSADRTLSDTDCSKKLYHPSADTTARTWTIDASLLTNPADFVCTFQNDASAGIITVTFVNCTGVLAGTGTTGDRALAANGIATVAGMTVARMQINGTGVT